MRLDTFDCAEALPAKSWGKGYGDENDEWRMSSKMAAGIQRLSKQALATFMTRETAGFSSNFERLKTMVSQLLAFVSAQIHFEVV